MRLTPLQMSVISSRSPGYAQFLSDLAKNLRFPWPFPRWIQLFGRMAYIIQGNTYVFQFIKALWQERRAKASIYIPIYIFSIILERVMGEGSDKSTWFTLVGMWLRFWAVVHCSTECAERLIKLKTRVRWLQLSGLQSWDLTYQLHMRLERDLVCICLSSCPCTQNIFPNWMKSGLMNGSWFSF